MPRCAGSPTNRRQASTNDKYGGAASLFVQLGDREEGVFHLSKAPTRPPDLGFPLLPLPGWPAPSFKSVTNADLEPPFHRPWDGGLMCPAPVFRWRMSGALIAKVRKSQPCATPGLAAPADKPRPVLGCLENRGSDHCCPHIERAGTKAGTGASCRTALFFAADMPREERAAGGRFRPIPTDPCTAAAIANGSTHR